MEVAEAKLEEAEKALRYGLLDATMILAYTAMFHAVSKRYTFDMIKGLEVPLEEGFKGLVFVQSWYGIHLL